MTKRKATSNDTRHAKVSSVYRDLHFSFVLGCPVWRLVVPLQEALTMEQQRVRHTEMLNASFFRCKQHVLTASKCIYTA